MSLQPSETKQEGGGRRNPPNFLNISPAKGSWKNDVFFLPSVGYLLVPSWELGKCGNWWGGFVGLDTDRAEWRNSEEMRFWEGNVTRIKEQKKGKEGKHENIEQNTCDVKLMSDKNYVWMQNVSQNPMQRESVDMCAPKNSKRVCCVWNCKCKTQGSTRLSGYAAKTEPLNPAIPAPKWCKRNIWNQTVEIKLLVPGTGP